MELAVGPMLLLHILTRRRRKSPGVTNDINDGLHAQYQDLETEAATWSSAIIPFITYTCAFPVLEIPVSPKQPKRKPQIIFVDLFLRCQIAQNEEFYYSDDCL